MKSELISIRPDARVESNGCHGTLEREEWRDVKGYEGLYQVSSFGRVRSVDRIICKNNGQTQKRKGGIMVISNDKDGYKIIGLRKDGKHYTCKVHRLVMEAFVPNPDNLPVINHRNEVKTANYPDNMEWCSVGYNNTYGTKLKHQAESQRGQKRPQVAEKLRGQKRPIEIINKLREARKKQMKPVLQFTLEGNLVAEYESLSAAVRENNYKKCGISACCLGRQKSHRNFIWKYK